MIPPPASHAFVCAALNPGRPAWPRHPDWTAIVDLTDNTLVTSAFYQSLRQHDRLADLPEGMVDYLALVHRLNEERNAKLRRQAIEAVRALNAAGIEPMLLKGGVGLFAPPRCEDTARMMADLDILVPEAVAEPAVTALSEIGYQVMLRYPEELHSYADLARLGKDVGGIDLHKEIVRHTYLLPAAIFWRHAQAVEVMQEDAENEPDLSDLRLFVPSPDCRILHNLLHAQAHDRGFYHGVVRLRDLHDLAMIVRCHATDIDWRWIEDRLAAHRLEVVLDAQLLLAERLLGLDWPLSRPPSAGAVVHRERCLVQMHSRRLAQLGRFWGNLRLAFAWHRLNQRYEGRGSPIFWQLHHAVDVLVRVSPARLLGELRRFK